MIDPQLDRARRELGLSLIDLWTDYFGLGGKLSAVELQAYLDGDTTISDDHDVVAYALNEAFHERGLSHPIAYERP